MTDNIHRLREYFIDKKQKEHLRPHTFDASEWQSLPSYEARSARRLCRMLEAQDCVFFPDSGFIPCRTTEAAPDIFTDGEWSDIRRTHTIHESGWMSNICPDYREAISRGLLPLKEEAEAAAMTADGDEKAFLCAATEELTAILAFADRYRRAAEEAGREDIAAVLRQVPANGARNYREALQFFRILHFTLWCEGDYHNVAGRLDQLFWPYFKKDREAGLLDDDAALALTCDFFLTFNCDSYLYPGMQQGDNGQSVVLGGRLPDGTDAYNELSELMLRASLELRLIDPKINLRVDKNTPLERFEFASRLTAVGIGFPQYANDDIVIPGLVRLGYSPEDAANYVVAACWEFILPGVGADIPNIDAISLLSSVDRTMRAHLADCGDFASLLAGVRETIKEDIDRITSSHNGVFFRPAPLLSVLCGKLPEKRDIRHGGKYNNFGIHATGLAPASDCLSAVKTLVFDRHELTGEAFLDILQKNYEGYEEVRQHIIQDTPRMGNDTEADEYGAWLLGAVADALDGKRNDRGGVWRAGCASAMYYVTHAAELGATGDGRRAGDFLPANYSPSLNTKLDGPMSVIRSFTKADLCRTINGGPLTLEFSPSVFRSEEGVKKLAMLVRTYIHLGGHQLQLNVISTEALLDAQKHPEKYKNLIVRVWGWSGYFVELDREYQEQIIRRSVLVTD